MPVSAHHGEISTPAARVHVYTYGYDRPSVQTRSPETDTLALFLCHQVPEANGYFHTTSGTSRNFALGDLIFIPAGASISAYGCGGNKQIVSCTVAGGLAPGDFDSSEHRSLQNCCDVRDERLSATMRRLAREAIAPGFGGDVLVEALTATLAVDLARYLGTQATPRQRGQARGGLSPSQLRRIEDYLYAIEGGRVRVSELAALVEVSSGHLMRAFKQSTGLTVHQFVERVRLSTAEKLLRETDLPLSAIATRMGFATASSFSLAFKRATTLSPGVFRRG